MRQEAYGGCIPLNTLKLASRAATVVSCCEAHRHTHIKNSIGQLKLAYLAKTRNRETANMAQSKNKTIFYQQFKKLLISLQTSSPLRASSFSAAVLGLERPSWKDSSRFHPAASLKDRQ